MIREKNSLRLELIKKIMNPGLYFNNNRMESRRDLID